jgi:DNA polymerase-3 subunit beta
MQIQITVSKSELLQKLKAASKVINQTNKVIPTHSNFLFEIGSELTVTGACESGNITAKIECEFTAPEKEFSFMADAKTMLDGLKELSEQPLRLFFNSESFNFEIYHEYGRFKVHASAPDFPTVKINSTDSKNFSVNANDFLFGLSSVFKFAGNDELRPMINAVYVGLDQNTITFCASDSHTLSEVKIKSETTLEKSELTLPQKLTKLLIDIDFSSDKIYINYTDKHICVSAGFFTIVYRQIEGKYFNYKSIIPRSNDKILTVDSRLIKSSISRVSVFSNKSSNLISLLINDGKLKITGRDNDFDQLAEETIPVEFNDESFEIGFNSHLLIKCIEEISSEELTMTFSDPTRQTLIFPKDDEVEKTILIMPLMINT